MLKKDHIYVNFLPHKYCGKCGTLKNICEFGKDNRRCDLLCNTCKECKKKLAESYRNKNRKKLRKQGLVRYYKNQNRLNALSKQYHYKKSCLLYGGKKLYDTIRTCNNYKNRLNEMLTYKILLDIFATCHISHNYRINTPNFKNRNFIKVDFRLFYKKVEIIIEYNGEQHYKIDYHFFRDKAEKRYKDQVCRDKFLRKYCNSKNILLIEIDGRLIKGYKKIKEYLVNVLTKHRII